MMNPFYFVNEFKNKPEQNVVRFATVDIAYSSGKPKLLFDGEVAMSGKTYPHLNSYTPVAGQRVMVLKGVIIGGIA